jgi:hypothetical protein
LLKNMKLNIFSDRCFLPNGIAHDSIFYPFWGNSLGNTTLPGASYYEALDQYCKVAQSLFELSPLEEADVVIFPGNLERVFDPRYLNLATELAEKAKLSGKLTAGFFWGDCSDKELPISCELVFRNSLYRSHKSPCDFAYPNWTVNFIETYFNGEVPVRHKLDKPVVGFCGFIGDSGIKFYAKRSLYQFRKAVGKGFPPPHYTGHLLRKKALYNLSKSKLVETNFILRDKMGFVGQASTTHNSYRTVYVKNMVESDYLFCCRGYGNYSYRFYEILSAGRIPVFLDTDCVLPYDFEIDWKKYCVWLKQEELPIIAEKIAEFHERLSPQEFIDLQHACYRIWKKKLSPEGFFYNFHKHLYLVN